MNEQLDKIRIIDLMWCKGYSIRKAKTETSELGEESLITQAYINLFFNYSPIWESESHKKLVEYLDDTLESGRMSNILIARFDYLCPIAEVITEDHFKELPTQLLWRAACREELCFLIDGDGHRITIYRDDAYFTFKTFINYAYDVLKNNEVRSINGSSIKIATTKEECLEIIKKIQKGEKSKSQPETRADVIPINDTPFSILNGGAYVFRHNDFKLLSTELFREKTEKELEEEKLKTLKTLLDKINSSSGSNVQKSVLNLKQQLHEIGQKYIYEMRQIKKSINKIRKTQITEEDLYKEFELIKKIPEIEDIEIEDGNVIFTIKPGEITTVNPAWLLDEMKEKAEDSLKLGTYKIEVSSNGLARSRSASSHPHISSDYNICYGSLQSSINAALANLDFYMFAQLTVELLKSYNYYDAYNHRLIQGTFVICDNCELLTLAEQCENCDYNEHRYND